MAQMTMDEVFAAVRESPDHGLHIDGVEIRSAWLRAEGDGDYEVALEMEDRTEIAGIGTASIYVNALTENEAFRISEEQCRTGVCGACGAVEKPTGPTSRVIQHAEDCAYIEATERFDKDSDEDRYPEVTETYRDWGNV